jgi:hypothetical protein
MNWNTRIRFGITDAGRLGRASLNLLFAVTLVVVTSLSGCQSSDERSGPFSNHSANTHLAQLSTSDLKARRSEVLKRYAEIQREIELKAGLPMGVAIKDDRALLGELYREAHEIDRELERRFTHGDPDVPTELVRAKW